MSKKLTSKDIDEYLNKVRPWSISRMIGSVIGWAFSVGVCFWALYFAIKGIIINYQYHTLYKIYYALYRPYSHWQYRRYYSQSIEIIS
jgi:hypothetical protein